MEEDNTGEGESVSFDLEWASSVELPDGTVRNDPAGRWEHAVRDQVEELVKTRQQRNNSIREAKRKIDRR